MTHPADSIIKALEEVDVGDPKAVGQFLHQIQDLLSDVTTDFVIPAVNFQRAKLGKESKDMLGAEDILPYRFGLIMHYAMTESNGKKWLN